MIVNIYKYKYLWMCGLKHTTTLNIYINIYIWIDSVLCLVYSWFISNFIR